MDSIKKLKLTKDNFKVTFAVLTVAALGGVYAIYR
jgi:hypothetical protein